MASSTLPGKSASPACTSCGARIRILTANCGSCGHRHTPREILEIAGSFLEAGMPRRSVRRQIAEAATGRSEDIKSTAARSFGDASQGTRLALLMAVQDFGDPRVMPPDQLTRHYDHCSPAVQAEIVLTLTRSESEDADRALEKLRGRSNDPRVLGAFEDQFFRSEVLSLTEPWPEVAEESIEEDEPAPVLDEEPEPSVIVERIDRAELEERDVTGSEMTIEEDSQDGYEPVEVVKKSVPPPIPTRPEQPGPPGLPTEVDGRAPAELSRPDLDAPPPRRAIRTFTLLLVLLIVLAAVTVLQVTRITRERQERIPPPRSNTPVVRKEVQEVQPSAAEELKEEEKGKGPIESHILAFEASASSQHRKYPASHVGDGNPATVWQEGKGEKPVKQYVFLAFPEEVTVTRIGILGGYDNPEGKHGDMFPLNNRLKKVEIAFSDAKVMFREFEDRREMQYFELQPPHRTRNLKITVLEVYRGSWFYDNAVAEIEVWGHEEIPAPD